jgi:hypothetical protein
MNKNNVYSHFASLLTLTVFIYLAFASSASKLHFQENYISVKPGSIENFDNNFVVMKKGDTLFGEKIREAGFFTPKLKIDEDKVKLKNVQAYYDGSYFYFNHKKYGFIKRVVVGEKCNVYSKTFLETSTETSTSPTGQTRTRNRTRMRENFYISQDNEEKLVQLTTLKQLKEIMNDCPDVANQLPNKFKYLRKAMKKDKQFLVRIFDEYNHCK